MSTRSRCTYAAWIALAVSVCACWSSPTAPGIRAPLPTQQPPAGDGQDGGTDATQGILRGRVTEAGTQRAVAYASVMGGGRCLTMRESAPIAETDEDGYFSLKLPVGTCGISVTYQFAQVIVEGIQVATDRVATQDIVLDRSAVRLSKNIPRLCPSSQSAPKDGIGASQSDAEELAATVLERFAAYRNTLTAGVLPAGPVDVLMDVTSPKVVLSAAVLPIGTREKFIPRTIDYARAQAKLRRRQRARMIQFVSIDSDGTCAIVMAGRGTSFDTDLYERRGRKWHFVRRVGGAFIE